MIQNIYRSILITLAVVGVVGLAGPATVVMAAGNAAEIACEGIDAGGCDAAGGETAVGNIVGEVINIIAFIIGAISVIVILLAGFRYITSSGDAAAIKKARDTLIYAVIGLFVALLVMLIVNFALGVADGGGSSGGSGPPPTVF